MPIHSKNDLPYLLRAVLINGSNDYLIIIGFQIKAELIINYLWFLGFPNQHKPAHISDKKFRKVLSSATRVTSLIF